MEIPGARAATALNRQTIYVSIKTHSDWGQLSESAVGL